MKTQRPHGKAPGNGTRIHRNITLRRLLLDGLQYVRSQRHVTHLFGPPFRRSRRDVEIDITYRCNLRCANCNRSCTQVPSTLDMPVDRIRSFLAESHDMGIEWRRIRLLGGEPTLHPKLPAVLEALAAHRRTHHAGMRIVLCTNGSGGRVRRALAKLPEGIEVKNTFKGPRQRLFRPFNMAPRDLKRYRWADFSSGCRILEDCGMGLTPMGIYPCAIAGGIDRIFGFGLGRHHLPDAGDDMADQLNVFCRLCGHFGFAWPTRGARRTGTWDIAYGAHVRSEGTISGSDAA